MCDTQENNLPYNRVATVKKKCLENETFSRSGKIREFCGWSGKFRKALESQGKVGNLKINGCGKQTSENLFCSRGKKTYFLMR